MDTNQSLVVPPRAARRRRFPAELKLQIIAETLEPGSSVSLVARRHDINANQLFAWRRLYQEGSLGGGGAMLPVRVREPFEESRPGSTGPMGSMEIAIAEKRITTQGVVSVAMLRAAIEALNK